MGSGCDDIGIEKGSSLGKFSIKYSVRSLILYSLFFSRLSGLLLFSVLRVLVAVMSLNEDTAETRPTYMETVLGERYLLYDPSLGCVHPLWTWGVAIVILMVVSDESIAEK